MRSTQTQTKISYREKFGIISEEADFLELLFLPFLIFQGFMEYEDIRQCFELSARMYPDGIMSREKNLFMLRDFIQSRKNAGKHNSLNKYLEKSFGQKLWFNSWTFDNLEPPIELLPFSQQLAVLRERGEGFL